MYRESKNYQELVCADRREVSRGNETESNLSIRSIPPPKRPLQSVYHTSKHNGTENKFN